MFDQLVSKVHRGLKALGFLMATRAMARSIADDLWEYLGPSDALDAADWLVAGEIPGDEDWTGRVIHDALDSAGLQWRSE